jgi:hypothetical protein
MGRALTRLNPLVVLMVSREISSTLGRKTAIYISDEQVIDALCMLVAQVARVVVP